MEMDPKSISLSEGKLGLLWNQVDCLNKKTDKSLYKMWTAREMTGGSMFIITFTICLKDIISLFTGKMYPWGS
jgi:hypothetical protein